MTDTEWNRASAIQQWWTSASQRGIKRPYSADTMALKLRSIFDGVQKNRRVNFTTNAVDAAAAELMAGADFDTVYVPGEKTVLSKIAVDGLGLDSTDHTALVPKNVATIHQSQLLHSRSARIRNASLLPIVADAGSDQGQHTSIMKLVKKLVQGGVAGFHSDDLLLGLSERRHESEDGVTTVLVPTNEYLRRLVAAKLQLDILGSEAVSIARTDAEVASHITSTIGHRDRPFVLGATVVMPRPYVHTEGNSARDE
ncbi:hypothetical protein IAU60_002211 [Kwoniella sp. DSM 27419]